MSVFDLPLWFLPILASAFGLGFYDLCKKHAVRDNPVMPVLFYATLCGSALFVAAALITGRFSSAIIAEPHHWLLILAKTILVATSWTCVYYAMRELPISIASPVRASAPLWTVIGGILLFHEIPSPLQGIGMLAIFIGYYLFSVFGKLEGISFARNKGIHFILLGTILGAASALYDKYLLGVAMIQRETLQLWFSIDLVFILGAAYLVRNFWSKDQKYTFHWRWSIPLTGILLIIADYLYFYAVSLPDVHISILSLIRRCNCIVTFVFGVWYFKETHIRQKAFALALILLGVFFLALAG